MSATKDLTNYDSYQKPLIAETIATLRADGAAVLAAAVSAGKTRMAMVIVNKLIKSGEVKSVLILAHGQTVIRANMANEAKRCLEGKVVSFDSFEVESRQDLDRWLASDDRHPVLIAIPQSLQSVKLPRFDMVIVDESHQFYHAEDGMVKKLLKRAKPKYSLCMSGTPSKHVRNGEKVVAISVFELRKHGAIANPTIVQGTSAYDFTLGDRTADGNLKESVKFTAKQTKATMKNLLEVIHLRKLCGAARSVRDTYKAMGKTMIACHSQKMAVQVADYFEGSGISVVLSTSEYGDDANAIDRFEGDPSKKVLIVVGRGVLGYSCKTLVNLVDMTCSMNMDRMMQLYGRILRLDPKNPDAKKFYLRVVPEKMAEYSYGMLNLMMSLCERERYISFDGRMSRLPFKAKPFNIGGDPVGGSKGTSRKRAPRNPSWKLDDLDLMSRVYSDTEGIYSDFAQDTMAAVEARINGAEIRRSPEEWVKIAEKLASENAGSLQGTYWLSNNGYSGLRDAIQKRPELFVGIPQEQNRRSPEDWVLEAKNLASKNNGVLPSKFWLRKNGKVWLASAMRNHPQLFAHFQQEKPQGNFKSPEEWVTVAEQMARENGGVLQAVSWLKNNDLQGLVVAMREHPELFAGFQQEKLRKNSVEDWVLEAEQIAQENKGALPAHTKLCKIGHGGLSQATYKHPKLFARIPQEILNSQGIVIGFRNGTAAQRRALEIKHGLRKA